MNKVRDFLQFCAFGLILFIGYGSWRLYSSKMAAPYVNVPTDSVVQQSSSGEDNEIVPDIIDDSPNEFAQVSEKEEENEKKVSVLFVGDTMLARSVGEMIVRGEDPFASIKEYLQGFDFVVANLECVVSSIGTPIPGKKFTFRAPIQAIQSLQEANIHVVSVANNHTLDYRQDAFLDMLTRFEQNQIEYFGGGKNESEAFAYRLIEKNGTKIALLAYNEIEPYYTKAALNKAGSAWFDEVKLEDSIKRARGEADIVVVMPHWGTEYSTKSSTVQKLQAQKLVDWGANLVVGAHPHVVQEIEYYGDSAVVYSLGNFVFDQMPQRKDSAGIGMALEVMVENGKIVDVNPRQIKLNPFGLAELLEE
jgi:poly-gamma-glutamate capsule biosynthesis protein CapA/YwtB (metallophosphatase superfamily)